MNLDNKSEKIEEFPEAQSPAKFYSEMAEEEKADNYEKEKDKDEFEFHEQNFKGGPDIEDIRQDILEETDQAQINTLNEPVTLTIVIK